MLASILELFWVAPEHLTRSSGASSLKGDIYSFGIILHEVATRALPYSALLSNSLSPEGNLQHLLSPPFLLRTDGTGKRRSDWEFLSIRALWFRKVLANPRISFHQSALEAAFSGLTSPEPRRTLESAPNLLESLLRSIAKVHVFMTLHFIAHSRHTCSRLDSLASHFTACFHHLAQEFMLRHSPLAHRYKSSFRIPVLTRL